MSHAFNDWNTDAELGEVRADVGAWMAGTKEGTFEEVALALFRWQASNNQVYRLFLEAMGTDVGGIERVDDIPCLPVEMFKHHRIQSGEWTAHHAFKSSGTSGQRQRSTHWLDPEGLTWYRDVASRAWSQIWGSEVKDHQWLGLLPGYVGREDASLLTMVHGFCDASGHATSRMFMDDHVALNRQLLAWFSTTHSLTLVLFGVTWAILDWLEGPDAPDHDWSQSLRWKEVILVETGGMKGRDEEPIREEVHARIRKALPWIRISSEYGMTEMLSQAYALDGQQHVFPFWSHAMVRDPKDPLASQPVGRSGRLDVVDLANVHSCAFLATSDLARKGDAGLSLLGRCDNAEARGCSLLTLG